jgi:hypothetical protein
VGLAVPTTPERRRRDSGHHERSDIGPPRHRPQGGSGQQLEADQRADTGLPGRPNTGTGPVEQSERERLGRLDGDLHPAHLGDAAEHDLHVVEVPHLTRRR